MARPPLSRDRIQSFRERLCAVALLQVTEQGIDALSWRSLAAELGCSHATPYRYFRNKKALIDALGSHGRSGLRADLEARLAGVLGTDARLRESIDGILSFAIAQPEVYRLIFSVDDEHEPFWSFFEIELRAAIEIGELEGDSAQLAQLIWATLHGLISSQLSGSLKSPAHHLSSIAVGILLDAHRPSKRNTHPSRRDWAVW